VTSSGRVRKQPSIQRAFRRLKTIPGTVPGQVNRASALSHPFGRMASSSAGPSDEQMLQTTLESGIPEQQIDGVVWRRDLDRG
jgi:hypothetical protein